MYLGEFLFELRKAEGLSQEEVAERLSVTRQTVSKWETGQSTPDFDKVKPLCDLYHISTEELFNGARQTSAEPEQPSVLAQPVTDADVNREELQANRQAFRERSAWVVSIAVFIYIASVVVLVLGIAVFFWNPVVMSCVMMLMIAFATAMLIRHFMARPKFEEPVKKEKTLKSRVKHIAAIITLIIYLLLSFLTMAWHITWILWCVYGLVCEIINLIFMLKEGKQHEA